MTPLLAAIPEVAFVATPMHVRLQSSCLSLLETIFVTQVLGLLGLGLLGFFEYTTTCSVLPTHCGYFALRHVCMFRCIF